MINYNNSIRLLLFILVVVIHMQYDYSVYAFFIGVHCTNNNNCIYSKVLLYDVLSSLHHLRS